MPDPSTPNGNQFTHFKTGDSIGFAALIITVIAMVLTPPWWLKVLMLISGTIGCVMFVRWSHWTYAWRKHFKIAAAAAIIIVIALVGVPQLVEQWRSEHPVGTPTFAFIKPGVHFNPNRSDAFWMFIIVVRGRDTLFNVDTVFDDERLNRDTTEQLASGAIPQETAGNLFQRAHATFHDAELNPGLHGEDNEAGKIMWRTTLNDQEYGIRIRHRGGSVIEKLRFAWIGKNWQFAMQVKDEASNKLLIKCRDAEFPVDEQWTMQLPTCFPKYPN